MLMWCRCGENLKKLGQCPPTIEFVAIISVEDILELELQQVEFIWCFRKLKGKLVQFQQLNVGIN